MVGVEVLLWRMSEAQEYTVWSEDLLCHTGKTVLLLAVHLGEVALTL